MRWLVCLAMLVNAMSCSPPCVPGEMETCECPGAAHGARLCGVSGALGACDCVPPPQTVIPDAGPSDVDAGHEPVCNLNQSSPRPSYSEPSQTLRVPLGGFELRLDEQFTFDVTRVWSLTYRVTHDGETRELPGDGKSAWFDADELGTYSLEVTVHWLCGESQLQRMIEVVPAQRLPWEITHGVCCDANQRAFVSVTGPPRVMRLEINGDVAEVARVSRPITSLALNAERTSLAVAQDSMVSVFDTNAFDLTFSSNTFGDQPLVWWAGPWLWVRAPIRFTSTYVTTRISPATGESIEVGGVSFPELTMAVQANEQSSVLCADNSGYMYAYTALPDGGLSTKWQSKSCDAIFPTSLPSTVITSDGELQTVVDGGFVYAGTLDLGRPDVIAAAPDRDAVEWLITNEYPGLLLREVALDSLMTRSTRAVGIVDPKLVSTMIPNFMFVDASGITHVFTRAQDVAGTSWEETFP
jgi:hypothetical protein